MQQHHYTSRWAGGNSLPLFAELIGSDTCTAGITAIGNAPVLKLCRLLVEAGHDPDTPMHVYRGATLALKLRSIGEGAALAVRDDHRGAPRFVRYRSAPAGRARECAGVTAHRANRRGRYPPSGGGGMSAVRERLPDHRAIAGGWSLRQMNTPELKPIFLFAQDRAAVVARTVMSIITTAAAPESCTIRSYSCSGRNSRTNAVRLLLIGRCPMLSSMISAAAVSSPGIMSSVSFVDLPEAPRACPAPRL